MRLKSLKKKQNELRIQLYETTMELLSVQCRDISESSPFVFDGKGSAENARVLADMGADRIKTAFAFSGSDSEGYKYAVASRSEDVRETGRLMNEALGGRGGGKPALVMGSVSVSKAQITAFIDDLIQKI